MKPDSRSNLAWLLALGLLGLTVSLRLPGMIGWWINPDEGAYFSMVTWADWGSFWKEVEVHAHPPLYYVLLRLVGLFTHEFIWPRAVALVSGTLAVLVSEEWAFSVHPEGLDQPDHLYTFIQAVDRELPEMRLSEQQKVLMFFEIGWRSLRLWREPTSYCRPPARWPWWWMRPPDFELSKSTWRSFSSGLLAISNPSKANRSTDRAL